MNWYKTSQQIRLWLDDVRDPTDPIIRANFGASGDEEWVRTSQEAIQRISEGNVSYISLDHDLGEGAGTGYDVASFVEQGAYEGTIKKLDWKVHSANPVGAKRIYQAMMNAEKFWDQQDKII